MSTTRRVPKRFPLSLLYLAGCGFAILGGMLMLAGSREHEPEPEPSVCPGIH